MLETKNFHNVFSMAYETGTIVGLGKLVGNLARSEAKYNIDGTHYGSGGFPVAITYQTTSNQIFGGLVESNGHWAVHT